jgi:hypothetical protein
MRLWVDRLCDEWDDQVLFDLAVTGFEALDHR